ncbi:MAG: aminopeptidase P family protein [Proteobacteria bacterium]|nr:aminopeptidase P family protein [Pseudomonadota bacterium]
MQNTVPSIISVQKYMNDHNLDALYIPKHDRFLNEYVQEKDDILRYVSHFSGSFGFCVITKDKGYLWVDGRYTLQAEQELDLTFWNILSYGQDSLSKFLKAKGIQKLAFDPYLVTVDQYKKWENDFENIKLIPLEEDWLKNIWQDRPKGHFNPVFSHDIEFSGMSAFEKTKELASKINHPYLIHQLDSLCWLLNLRGGDIPFTPVFYGSGILYPNSTVDLFIHNKDTSLDVLKSINDFITVYEFDDLKKVMANLNNLLIHEASTPYALTIQNKDKFIPSNDLIIPVKALKNSVEQKGMKDCHIEDAIAVIETLYWLDNQDKADLTECDVSDYLSEQRKKRKNFIQLSFETIAGSGPNGAIIHYHATKDSNRCLKDDSLLLLDSGGQYFNGTTDVARTICIGKVTEEQIERYTDVLKGNIALSSITFPKETSGSQLDVLARQYLWKQGLDFKHGTGHGVGYCLNVHEKPQSISKFGTYPLKAGMVVSNEPGFYKEQAFGIRLENLELIKESRFADFLEFETLTLIPFDKRLIDVKSLTNSEKEWINKYNEKIKKSVMPYISNHCQNWLLNFI